MVKSVAKRSTIIGILVGLFTAIVFIKIFAAPNARMLSSDLLKPSGLIFVAIMGGIIGGIVGAIVQKVVELDWLAILWTGLIVGVIPSIIVTTNIFIDIFAASYNVLLIEGFAVIFSIGFIWIVFPGFGLLCSLFLNTIWKFTEIAVRRLRRVGNS